LVAGPTTKERGKRGGGKRANLSVNEVPTTIFWLTGEKRRGGKKGGGKECIKLDANVIEADHAVVLEEEWEKKKNERW